MLFTRYFGLDFVILLSVVLYLLHKYISKNFDYWKKRNVFFVKPIPFFGNFLDIALFRISIGEYLTKLYNQTEESFFGIFVFGTPHLVVKDPELIKAILVKDFHQFDDRTVVSDPHDIASQMLFLNKNPDWKIMRSKMTPLFTSGKLKAMIPIINQVGEDLEIYLEKNQGIDSFECKEVCAKYSTDLIAKSAFGIHAHSFDFENAEFRKMGRLLFDFRWSTAIQQTSCFFFPTLVKIFGFKFVDKRATDFMRDAFWHTISEREKHPELRSNDVIDALMELRKDTEFKKKMNFEGDRAVAQAVQFFVAGFETTSSTMAFTLYELCIHPEMQNRLREEIKSSIKEHGGLTYEGIQNMKFLNMCVSEVLRKYPALPFLDRRCRSDYQIPGSKVVIEKGTPVYIPMFGLHYDEKYFPNPQKFDPERFSSENAAKIVPFSYIPFGVGPRNCIGERFGLIGTKFGVAHVISEFEVLKTSRTPDPIVFEPKSLIVAAKGGLPVRFKKIVT